MRIELIAANMRGQVHLDEFLKRNDVEVTAIAGPEPEMVEMVKKILKNIKNASSDLFQWQL